MKVEVDKNICIGCGACASLNPNNFSIDDDGLAKANENEIIDEKEKEDVIDAMECCPVSAIKEKN